MTTTPGSFCENEGSLAPAKATCPSVEVDMKESLWTDDIDSGQRARKMLASPFSVNKATAFIFPIAIL